MVIIVMRFAVALIMVLWGSAIFFKAGSKSLGTNDPAFRLIRITLIPEVLYTGVEAAFLVRSIMVGAGFAIGTFSHTAVGLLMISEITQMLMGLCYILFCYRHFLANGLSLSGLIPFRVLVALTAANYLVYFLKFHYPLLAPGILVVNNMVTGLTMLYAGLCAIGARGKKRDFLPSTKGGFWIAFFCLAYFPFVGIFGMFVLTIPILDSGRPVSLQLFPFRELIVLAIITVHLEPIYSLFRIMDPRQIEGLSSREREVAILVCEGASNNFIALRLNISLPTVKSHVRNILRKYGVSSRNDLGPIFANDEAAR